jgi:hypothetical protein
MTQWEWNIWDPFVAAKVGAAMVRKKAVEYRIVPRSFIIYPWQCSTGKDITLLLLQAHLVLEESWL